MTIDKFHKFVAAVGIPLIIALITWVLTTVQTLTIDVAAIKAQIAYVIDAQLIDIRHRIEILEAKK